MESGLVYATLENACCQDAAQQQAAMKALHAFESENGFVSALIEILRSGIQEIKTDCRLLAAICLKNVVSRCWKTRGANTREIMQNEKAALKSFLLSHLSEKDVKVFLQLSAVAAKIARSDWPTEWPDLVNGLFSSTQSGNDWFAQSQAMILLRDVLGSLKSNTLAPVKKIFAETAASVFPMLFSTWLQLSDNARASLITAVTSTDRNLPVEALLEHLIVTTQVLSLISTKGLINIQQAGTDGMLVSFFDSFSTRLHNFSVFLRANCGALEECGSAVIHIVEEQDDDGSEGAHTVSTDIILAKLLPAVEAARRTLMKTSEPIPLTTPQCVFVLMLRRLTRLMGGLLVDLQKEHPLELAPYLGQLLGFFSGHLEEHYQYGYSQPSGNVSSQEPATAQPAQTPFMFANLSSWLPSCISAVLFLSNSLHCRAYNEEVTGRASVVRRSLELERKILGAAAGNAATTASAFDAEAAAAHARMIRGQFFTNERTSAFLDLLLLRLLRYGTRELASWAEEPEIFFEAQENHREQDTIKTAAEGFYLSLLSWAPELVAARMASLLCDLQRQLTAVALPSYDVQDPAHFDAAMRRNEEIFFWDGVYLCAGLNSAVLMEYLDASQWIAVTAGPLMHHLLSGTVAGALLPPTQRVADTVGGGGQQILRARFLWLLGCLSYQFDPAVLTQLVQLLLSVFEAQEDSDSVVLMNAITAMQCVLCVEGVSANTILGTEAIVRLVGALCTFAGQKLQESETRKRVVDLIGGIIDSVGSRKLKQQPDLLSALIVHLTQLWTTSDVNSPLRVSIIEAVEAVMKAAGSFSSSPLHPCAYPLIEYATSGTQESSFLAKEGIKLWLTIVRNTVPTSYSHPLCELVNKALPSIFEHGLLGEEEEDLQELMLVLEANAIAGGSICLHSCAQAMYMALSRTLGQVGARSVPFVVRPIEALLLACPQDATAFLLQSGLLLDLLKPCCASMPEYSSQLEDMQEADIAIVSYLSVLARIALVTPAAASEAANALAVHPDLVSHLGGATGGVLLRGLIRLMIDKFDCVGYCTGGSYRRRLWALSLLSLYPTQDSVVLDWFPEVVSAADSILCEEEADAAERRTGGADNISTDSNAAAAAAAATIMLATSQELLMAEANGCMTELSLDERDAIITSYEALLKQDVVMNSPMKAVVREVQHRE